MFRYAAPITLLLISPALYAEGPICGPHPRAWDKDHALIEEAALTPEQVKKAQADIEAAKRPAPNAPGELAKQRFCAWMANHAFWPE